MSNKLTNNETNLNDINSNVELNNNQENKEIIQDINKIIEINNYPYGYKLTTTKKYQIEFVLRKGFRLIETTLNPKTKQWNKPKKSVYYNFMYLTNDNGFIDYHILQFNIIDKINFYENFIKDNQNKLNLTLYMVNYLNNKLKDLQYGYEADLLRYGYF